MWWLIWSILVVGTLVGAFFLLRDLWRKGMRLAKALSEASQTFADASVRISDAVEQAKANAPDTSPTIFDDPVELRERVTLLREERAERAAARRERRLAVARGWSLDAWLTQRKFAKSSHSGRL